MRSLKKLSVKLRIKEIKWKKHQQKSEQQQELSL